MTASTDGIGLGGLDRHGVPLRVGVAEDVDGVAHARRRRELLPEVLGDVGMQRGDFHAARLHGVGGHDPGAAGVGDDGHAVALGQGLHGQRGGEVEQRLEGVGPDDAGPLERRPVGDVRAGQRAGVRGGGLRAGRRGPRLEDHHRLDGRHRFRGPDELVAGADALQVAHDHLGPLVVGERGEEVGLVEVGLVTDADQGRQAHLARRRPVEDGRAESARLRHARISRRPPACGWRRRRSCSWWVLMRPRQFGPIRRAPEEWHRSAISRSRRAPSSPTSLKPAVITTTALAPCRSEDDHRPLHRRRRYRDDAQVDLLAVLLQARVDLVPEQVASGRVDRNDIPLKSPLDKVGYHGVADFSRRAGCPHHRDRLWIEQRLKHGTYRVLSVSSLSVSPAGKDDTTSPPADFPGAAWPGLSIEATMTNMRNALKAVGAVLAVVALCAPLMLLPGEDTQPRAWLLGRDHHRASHRRRRHHHPGLRDHDHHDRGPAPATGADRRRPPPPPAPSTSPSPRRETCSPPTPLLESVREPQDGSYDFGPVFAPIAPYLAKADYAVAALEPRLAGPQAGYSADPDGQRPSGVGLRAQEDGDRPGRHRQLPLPRPGVGGGRGDARPAGCGRSGARGHLPLAEGADHPGDRRHPGDQGGLPQLHGLGCRTSSRRPTRRTSPSTCSTWRRSTEDAMTARSWGADAVVAMLNYGIEYEREPSVEQVGALRADTRSRRRRHTRFPRPRGAAHRPHLHLRELAGQRQVRRVLPRRLPALRARPDRSDSGLIAYLHLEKRDLRTYVTGVSYLPLYVQVSDSVATGSEAPASDEQPAATYPDTSSAARAGARHRRAPHRRRQADGWRRYGRTPARLLYRPDEKISPLVPGRSRPLNLHSAG